MRSFTIAVLTLPLVACSTSDEVEEPAHWFRLSSMLSCEPETITVGQPLTLTLGKSHGSELAIYSHQDLLFYFLVARTAPKDMHSLMSPDTFEKSGSVMIASDATGYRWTSDGANIPILMTPGKYTIYVSEILESELGGYACDFEVWPK